MTDAKSWVGAVRLTKARTTRRANTALMNAKCETLAHALGEIKFFGAFPPACRPPPPR